MKELKKGRKVKSKIAVGKAQGTASIGIVGDRMQFQFIFKTDVEHFEINEHETIPWFPSTPWQIIDRANDAFFTYVSNALETVPNLAEYILIER